LWVVFLWIFQEARSEQAADVAPSAPPHSALPTHSVLIGTKKNASVASDESVYHRKRRVSVI
jgi:hypothetical protein